MFWCSGKSLLTNSSHDSWNQIVEASAIFAAFVFEVCNFVFDKFPTYLRFLLVYVDVPRSGGASAHLQRRFCVRQRAAGQPWHEVGWGVDNPGRWGRFMKTTFYSLVCNRLQTLLVIRHSRKIGTLRRTTNLVPLFQILQPPNRIRKRADAGLLRHRKLGPFVAER